MQSLLNFIQSHKNIFEAAQALNSVVSLLVWCVGAVLLFVAWRRNAIRSVSLGPINFQMQEAAVEAAATAARDWQARGDGKSVDVTRIRSTVSQAFSPEIADKLIGKSILWVDDNPWNNTLVVRALDSLKLDVLQETSTELGLEAMKRRHFDLVISDMGRGTNMRAGYDLLAAIRKSGNKVPLLIFAGSDSPEYRREAEAQGAQLSTNDMIELMDTVIRLLGK